jgi:hypothetical protein
MDVHLVKYIHTLHFSLKVCYGGCYGDDEVAEIELLKKNEWKKG